MRTPPKDYDMLDKLALLAMMDGLGGCTRDQLMRFAVEARLMKQFRFLLILAEVQEAGFIREKESAEGTLLILTPEGRSTLELLKDDLPAEISDRIHGIAPQWRIRFRDERQLPAAWEEKDGRCMVTLRALEDGEESLRITLQAVSRRQAQQFCRQWPRTAADIYGTLIARLGGPDEKKQ